MQVFNRIYLLILLTTISFCLKGQDSSLAQNSKKHWFNFNLNGALVANNSFSNLSTSDLNYKTYSPNSKTPVCYGFSIGVDFLIGKRDEIKQIIGLSYNYTNSDFFYNLGISTSSSSEISSISIARNAQFFNLSYGLLVELYRNLDLSLQFSYDQLYFQSDVRNGYHVSKGIQNKMTGQTYFDSTNYNNSTIVQYNTHQFISFRPKVNYTFNTKNKSFGIFISANFGFGYKAPWWMTGLQYYPFRKLR